MRWICFALLAAAGCATGSHAVVAHGPTQRFTGDPYDVYDDGARIAGQVCGLNVEYTVTRSDGKVVLSGFSDTGRPMYLEVRDEGEARRITGSLGTRVGTNEVDLRVAPDRLTGRAGVRRFELGAVGDELHGSMSALNTQGAVPAIVAGRSELAQLPNDALGAILPPLLNCNAPFGPPAIRPAMMVRVGGPAGYDTRYSNEVGRAH
jgi:hypothetical protein